MLSTGEYEVRLACLLSHACLGRVQPIGLGLTALHFEGRIEVRCPHAMVPDTPSSIITTYASSRILNSHTHFIAASLGSFWNLLYDISSRDSPAMARKGAQRQDMTEEANRKRIAHRKSRKGCGNCKLRRVKVGYVSMH